MTDQTEEPPASFSSLRARFEQLSTSKVEANDSNVSTTRGSTLLTATKVEGSGSLELRRASFTGSVSASGTKAAVTDANEARKTNQIAAEQLKENLTSTTPRWIPISQPSSRRPSVTRRSNQTSPPQGALSKSATPSISPEDGKVSSKSTPGQVSTSDSNSSSAFATSKNGPSTSTSALAPPPVPPSRSRTSSAASLAPSKETDATPSRSLTPSPSTLPRWIDSMHSTPSASTSPSATEANRKNPPPVPVSRKPRPVSPVESLNAAESQKVRARSPSDAVPTDTSSKSYFASTGTDLASTSPTSVKTLASRFSNHQRPQTATENTASAAPTTEPAPQISVNDEVSRSTSPVEASLGYSDEEEEDEDEEEEAVEALETIERIRSESPEDLRSPPSERTSRPPIPQRPIRPEVPPRPSFTIPVPGSGPVPLLPRRSSTTSSLPSPSIMTTDSQSTPSTLRRLSPSPSSEGLAPSSSIDVPPPPVRRLVAPVKKMSDPIPQQHVPKVPTRPTASVSNPPPMFKEPDVYVPPPPPSRSLAVHERLAPKRPVIASHSDEGGQSSDEECAEEAGTASSQLPDATFANRRPPVLKNRRSIHPQGQFYSFALSGTKLVTGQHHIYVWDTRKSPSTLVARSVTLPGEHKVHSIEFLPEPSNGTGRREGRFIWAGTKDGHLFEVDTEEMEITMTKHHAHAGSVIGIYQCGQGMVTIDESGKVLVWSCAEGEETVRLGGAFKSQRIPDKQNFHAIVGTELWTSSGPMTKPGSSAYSMRSPHIRVFKTSGDNSWFVLPRPITTPDSAGQIGAVTASAIVPGLREVVFLGHDNGYVSVWNRKTYACERVQRVSPYMLTSIVGVGKNLWVGFRNGSISVIDVVTSQDVWTVQKTWKAHRDPVTKLVVDPTSLWIDSTLQVASAGLDLAIHSWDGLLRDDWLDAELHLRQPEYCTFRSIRTLCISWNVDAQRPTDLVGSPANFNFLNDVLTSVESPDIISFGFQEMINLEDKKLTAKSMLLGKKKGEQKFADGISSSYRIWHDKLVHAVRLAMPPECPYTVVHVGDMIGLFSCIFVKTSEAGQLRDVARTTVKTGMGGRYGNKGAILSRLVVDDTSICFINCHLAAGQTHRRQRDNDLVDILEDKSTFSELSTSSPGAYALGSGGTTVFDHEIVILGGDLNYRIDTRRDLVVQAVKEGDLASLLANDQLLKGTATNQTFRLRSFKEPTITFAPTYKYDPGTDEYDTSSKRRIPAWCDRMLYRADRSDKITPIPEQYRRWEVNISDHRPISAAFDLRIKCIDSNKRAQVWTEVESAWRSVEEDKLDLAIKYYG